MRLTLVISSLSAGGAERTLSHLARGFLNEGYEVAVVTFFGKETDFYHLPEGVRRYTGIDFPVSSNHPLRRLITNIRKFQMLRANILASRPDVVISFTHKVNEITLLALIGTAIPLIISEHNEPMRFSHGRVWHWIRRLLYPYATRLVSVCEGVDRYFSRLPEHKRAVIYNPVDIDQTQLIPDPLSSLIVPCTLVAMGRLIPEKGFDLLLRAFAQVSPQFPTWQLVILGEGPERPRLEQLTQHLNLTNVVKLPGLAKNPFSVLEKADLFVFSSRSEGFGVALAEALACGVPAVSFDCPYGPAEIITDGVNGILVPPEDVDAFAQAMSRLMGDDEERRHMAARASEVLNRFGLEKIIASWNRLLTEIAA